MADTAMTDAPAVAGTGAVVTSAKKKAAEFEVLEARVSELLAQAAASPAQLTEVVEALLSLEKTQRLDGDVAGTKLTVVSIVRACFAAKAWPQLNENVLLLSKRRSQLKQAITAMVQECMTFLDATPDVDTKVALIKALIAVSEGKIFVEVERARLTRLLAKLAEERGDIGEAADVLQEVAVETYGGLCKEEKVAFVLEQVRLVLDRGDFVRAQILSKKVNARTFAERELKPGAKPKTDSSIAPPAEGTPTLAQLKLIYYGLMVRYHLHSNDYLEVCRCHAAVLGSPSVAADASQWAPALSRVALFAALSPRSPMQSSLLASTAADKRLAEALPLHAALLSALTTHELVPWPALAASLEPALAAEGAVFAGDVGAARRADLALRVVEHNVHVVSRYYSRVTLPRLAALISLDEAAAEARLSAMVSSGAVKAKLDRPAKVVTFASPAVGGSSPDELLNSWAASTEKLLGLVELASHKINKDAIAHRVTLSASA